MIVPLLSGAHMPCDQVSVTLRHDVGLYRKLLPPPHGIILPMVLALRRRSPKQVFSFRRWTGYHTSLLLDDPRRAFLGQPRSRTMDQLLLPQDSWQRGYSRNEGNMLLFEWPVPHLTITITTLLLGAAAGEESSSQRRCPCRPRRDGLTGSQAAAAAACCCCRRTRPSPKEGQSQIQDFLTVPRWRRAMTLCLWSSYIWAVNVCGRSGWPKTKFVELVYESETRFVIESCAEGADPYVNYCNYKLKVRHLSNPDHKNLYDAA